jgi:SAM-dependent methyltransferase
MQQHQNYTRKIIADQEEALSKIVSKIPIGSVVLDVGCGTGMLGQFLCEHKACIVDGVDIDPEAIALAKPKYRRVGVFNLESDSLAATFKAETYDCIVMADVVEHIVHPELLFHDIKQLLKPGGMLLFSIPNITHLASGLELVLGKFGYRNSGLLDSTHVRFYSLLGFTEKLESNGIYPLEIDAVKKAIEDTEFGAQHSFPRLWIDDIIKNRDDALTYQWIITAQIFKPNEVKYIAPRTTIAAEHRLTLASRLYWKSIFDSGYAEERSIAGHILPSNTNHTIIIFKFTEDNCKYPLDQLRLDPVSESTPFVFYRTVLNSPTQEVIWTQARCKLQEVFNARLIQVPNSDIQLFVPSNADPQWHPNLDPDVYRLITPGCTLRLELELSANSVRESLLTINDALFTEQQTHVEQIKNLNEHEIDLQQQCSLHLNALQELNSQLQELNSQLQEQKELHNSQLQELNSQLQEQNELHNSQLQELNSQLQKQNELHSLNQTEKTALLEDLTASRDLIYNKLITTEQQLIHSTEELARSKSDLTTTWNTMSWKVTKPLRWIRRKWG